MRLIVLPGLVLAAALISCGGGKEPVAGPGTPVVLISIDTLRSDHLSVYGGRSPETTHLDRFASESILFERAYSHYPLTLPSHASIFTGLLPPGHGVRDNRGFALPDDLPTLAERLQEAGYATVGVVSSMVLRRETGIAQGFDIYDDLMAADRGGSSRRYAERAGDETLRIAVERLAEIDPRKPFFFFLHLFDPHAPYKAPEPFATRYPDPYSAEVAYADELVGRFLAELRGRGLYDSALIVILSDHGEGLGDHVESEHGLLLYREALQVPLMIKLPDRRRAGERVTAPVALADVMPTILEAVGLGAAAVDGQALLGGAALEPDRSIYSETFFSRYQYGWSELRSVVRNEDHYIQAPSPELYDLLRDPAELVNLFPQRGADAAMLDAIESLGEGKESRALLSEEDGARLAALGYVGGAGPAGDWRSLPDPKAHIRDAEELWSLVRQGQPAAAAPSDARLRELLETLGRGNEELHRAVAWTLWGEQRLRIAHDILVQFENSDSIETQLLIGKLATGLGRFPEAHAAFDRALALDSGNPEAQMAMGTLLMTEGNPQSAGPWLERAVAIDPDLAEAWNGLGVLRAGKGDLPGALAAWEQAVDSDPALADAWFNLALARRAAGDGAGAKAALESYAALAGGEERDRALRMLRELEER